MNCVSISGGRRRVLGHVDNAAVFCVRPTPSVRSALWSDRVFRCGAVASVFHSAGFFLEHVPRSLIPVSWTQNPLGVLTFRTTIPSSHRDSPQIERALHALTTSVRDPAFLECNRFRVPYHLIGSSAQVPCCLNAALLVSVTFIKCPLIKSGLR